MYISEVQYPSKCEVEKEIKKLKAKARRISEKNAVFVMLLQAFCTTSLLKTVKDCEVIDVFILHTLLLQ